ncbi:MAG: outer membrane protein assembly factor BamD, partial [Nannocystaceae bacterium]
ELLFARSEFARGDYVVAHDAFRQFTRLHPTHKHVQNGWVTYMAALAAFKNAPKGIWPLPPHYQKDQSQLAESLTELRYFYDHHSGSKMEPYANKLRDEVNRRLLRHELYVAEFYLDRGRTEAAIGRLQYAHEHYPGIGLDAEVLFMLGLTYLRMDEIELARTTFTELQAQHPDHHNGKQARLYLSYIFDNFGPADPSRPRPKRGLPRPFSPPQPKVETNPNLRGEARTEAIAEAEEEQKKQNAKQVVRPPTGSIKPAQPASSGKPAGQPQSTPASSGRAGTPAGTSSSGQPPGGSQAGTSSSGQPPAGSQSQAGTPGGSQAGTSSSGQPSTGSQSQPRGASPTGQAAAGSQAPPSGTPD